jgi:ATP-dependent DNA helicase DinG
LLMQGEGSKNDLLQRFPPPRQCPFWSAARASGKASMCVARRCRWSLSTKFPFAPPDDPVLSARIEQMKPARAAIAFMEYQLPRAVINVKQGAGRLIRDESDQVAC